MSNEYERLRLKNIEDNKRVLSELGVLNPFKPLPQVIKKGRLYNVSSSSQKRKCNSVDGKWVVKKYIINDGSCKDLVDNEIIIGHRRRSHRLQGKDAPDVADVNDEWEKSLLVEKDKEDKVRVVKDRPMVYGHIPDVIVGTTWLMRIEVNHAGIHRPTVAGIHPGPEGAYSIALSGGYEDDIDLGECFTYTGEGGRDLKGTKTNPKNLRTAAQSKDQRLSRGNLALVRSMETGLPVRVLRGYKLDSPYAPDEGYRYDGLYKVEKWWYTTGMAGFGVYKFALCRVEDQPPPPWEYRQDQLQANTDGDNKSSADSGVGSQSTDINSQMSEASNESDCGIDDKETKIAQNKDTDITKTSDDVISDTASDSKLPTSHIAAI